MLDLTKFLPNNIQILNKACHGIYTCNTCIRPLHQRQNFRPAILWTPFQFQFKKCSKNSNSKKFKKCGLQRVQNKTNPIHQTNFRAMATRTTLWRDGVVLCSRRLFICGLPSPLLWCRCLNWISNLLVWASYCSCSPSIAHSFIYQTQLNNVTAPSLVLVCSMCNFGYFDLNFRRYTRQSPGS